MFNPDILTNKDFRTLRALVGAEHMSDPDFEIAPDGITYLSRWYLMPRPDEDAQYGGNLYLHIQVGDDPERPLHDHPWHNQSVIMSGGYDEMFADPPFGQKHLGSTHWRTVRQGDVIQRRATQAHRLFLPIGIQYTMTMFSTGPVIRDWGFWFEDGWRSHKEVTALMPDGRSVFINPGVTHAEPRL